LTQADIIDQFRRAMQAAGIDPPDEIVADGRLHRFATSDKSNDDAGWYTLHADGIPAGAFGCWRSGISETWRADLGRRLTPAEEAEARRRIEKARTEAEAERKVQQDNAARRAGELWLKASHARRHPYLNAKRISAHGIRQSGDSLLVPLFDADDVLRSLQFVGRDGTKKFLPGGRVTGCFHLIGELQSAGTLLVCEGYATGASLHEATGMPVAVAFSAGNLKPVSLALRAKYPDMRLIVCADNDSKPESNRNPGLEKATEAALAVGGLLAVPPVPGDFNDYCLAAGAEAVRRAIANATAPARDEQPEEENAPGGEYARDVSLIRASDLEPEPITWLWPGWLAAGKVHILAGAPGTGKTTIALALAATITSGGRWPDGTRAEPGNVIVWSSEDDPRDTLVPRLALMGADLSRVFFVGDVLENGERRSFDPARDVESLRRKLVEIGGAKLVIFDPVVCAVAGDSHRNAEVRRGLQPLADLARDSRCALLGITHFSKATAGREPLERLNGSIAFSALARVVMVATKRREEGEDGRTVRVLCRAKSNVGPDDGAFEYDLRQAELKTHPGVFSIAVLWGRAIEGTARELLAEAEADQDDVGSTLEEAKRFLADLLADGPLTANEIKRDADSAGYSWRTIHRAADKLGVEKRKEGGTFGGRGAVWRWYLPNKPTTQDATRCQQDDKMPNLKGWHLVGGLASCAEVEHLGPADGGHLPQDAQDATRCSTKKSEHLVERLSTLCEKQAFANEDVQREHLQGESLKMLKSAEDAQQKKMSTFREVEHLQGEDPEAGDLDEGIVEVEI
jgi:putative DNA primase/helicase